MRKYILVDREPVVEPDLEKWASAFNDMDARRVARTGVGDSVAVSTVFLGMDHGFREDGLPLLFETMVFGGPMDGDEDRYATWSEAEAGHARKVAAAEAAQ